MPTADLPFHLQLALDALDALFGILILGLVVLGVSRLIDSRRAFFDLKQRTVTRMTEVVYPLYMQIADYFTYLMFTKPREGAPAAAAAPSMASLHEAFLRFRIEAAVVQTDLETYFRVTELKHEAYVDQSDQGPADKQPVFSDAAEPWTIWHSIKDLMQVAYFSIDKPFQQTHGYAQTVAYHTTLDLKYPSGSDEELIANYTQIKKRIEAQLLAASRSVKSAKRAGRLN